MIKKLNKKIFDKIQDDGVIGLFDAILLRLRRKTSQSIHRVLPKRSILVCRSIYKWVPRQFYARKLKNKTKFYLKTDYPVAWDSPDHLYPLGAKNDNSVNREFNKQFYKIAEELGYSKPYTVLDLGCAGGGMVKTFIADGHEAVGIEGSNYNRKNKQFEWPVIPDNLFTADITKPFKVYNKNNEIVKFDLITAWEFLEHIKKKDLLQVSENIKVHIAEDGIFVCSISHSDSFNEGVKLHQIVEPPGWWDNFFSDHGFKRCPGIATRFKGEFVRKIQGSSNRIFKIK